MIASLKNVKTILNVNKTRVDSCVFRLHYKFTVFLLITFSVLLSTKQYFGDPIKCFPSNGFNMENKETLETFCWINGTYSIKGELASGEKIWHGYYQWICILFWLQAAFFYVPWYLWKNWEGGRLQILVKDLCNPLDNPEWNVKMNKMLSHYIISEKNLHLSYALRYNFCETLNVLNLLLQIFATNCLLDGKFIWYGINFLTSEEDELLFPHLTKCDWETYGAGGDVQNRDARCVLPLNVLNKRLFLIQWFWLLILGCITALSLFCRFAVYLSFKLRRHMLTVAVRHIAVKEAELIIKNLSYGSFFLLHQIGKHVNPDIFKDLVFRIYHEIVDMKLQQHLPSSVNHNSM